MKKTLHNKQSSSMTLQTRGVEIKVKERAEKAAKDMGFSTLQDAVRFFIHQLADDKIDAELDIAYEEYKKGDYIDVDLAGDVHKQLLGQ